MSLTLVTGASSNHFRCLKNLLWSIEYSQVRARTLVYDLGLAPSEVKTLQANSGIELRTFDFANYPSHVDIRVNRGWFAWKPIIVHRTMSEFGGQVLWLDGGDLVYGNLSLVQWILRNYGIYSPRTAATVRRWTHPTAFRYLKATDDLWTRRTRNAAIAGFDSDYPGIRALVDQWRDCALHLECIAPEGSDASNHRWDQSALSILAYQFQETHPGCWLVGRSFEIDIHADDLSDDEVKELVRRLGRKRWREFLKLGRDMIRAWLKLGG